MAIKLEADQVAILGVGHVSRWISGTYRDVIRPVTYHRWSYGREWDGARPACGVDSSVLNWYTVELAVAQAVAKPCRRCYPKEAE